MTFILKWNPEVSNIKAEDWKRWKERFPFITPNWSVWEHEKSDDRDRFFMVRVGEGRTGLVMRGRFCSMPKEGDDWSGKGRKVFYRDMYIDNIMDPETDPIITTEELEAAVPDFDWRAGHSGMRLSDAQATAVERLWKKFEKDNTHLMDEQGRMREMVIEPSALARVKGDSLWKGHVCSWLDESDNIYGEDATHDCVNLSFGHDYTKHLFRLKVWFQGGVLEIRCKDVHRIRINLSDAGGWMSDFSLTEAGHGCLRLNSNGIDILADKIEFRKAEDSTDGWVPICI